MKTFLCTVCGYVHRGDEAPMSCPVCRASKEKFVEQSAGGAWADEHRIGVAQGVDAEIMEELRANFIAECTEVVEDKAVVFRKSDVIDLKDKLQQLCDEVDRHKESALL